MSKTNPSFESPARGRPVRALDNSPPTRQEIQEIAAELIARIDAHGAGGGLHPPAELFEHE